MISQFKNLRLQEKLAPVSVLIFFILIYNFDQDSYYLVFGFTASIIWVLILLNRAGRRQKIYKQFKENLAQPLFLETFGFTYKQNTLSGKIEGINTKLKLKITKYNQPYLLIHFNPISTQTSPEAVLNTFVDLDSFRLSGNSLLISGWFPNTYSYINPIEIVNELTKKVKEFNHARS